MYKPSTVMVGLWQPCGEKVLLFDTLWAGEQGFEATKICADLRSAGFPPLLPGISCLYQVGHGNINVDFWMVKQSDVFSHDFFTACHIFIYFLLYLPLFSPRRWHPCFWLPLKCFNSSLSASEIWELYCCICNRIAIWMTSRKADWKTI